MSAEELENRITIVDNEDGDRSVGVVLRSNLETATRLDIATGYFEVGGLFALGDAWQSLDSVRILMGSATGSRTKKLLLDEMGPYLRDRFDEGLARGRTENPLFVGLLQIAEAMRDGRIECRLHADKGRKFHAKAFLVYGGESGTPNTGIVGSSNFTRAGLEKNTELNVAYEEPSSTQELADWFEDRWEESEEFTDEFLEVLEKTIRDYSPWLIYLKSVGALLEDRELTTDEWERSGSTIYPLLDESQKRGYRQLLAMATGQRGRGGAFLCDGVGMGKTFIGLMLIERFCRREKKRIALFAPKSAKESVWEKELADRLPDLDSAYGKKVLLFAHTDFHRRDEEWSRRFDQVREEADVVIIDESHYFRNKGSKKREGVERSWYRKLYDLIENPDGTRKTVFLLTATPINNSLRDLQHQAELFLGENNPDSLAHLGISSLPAEIKQLEQAIEAAREDPANRPEMLADSTLFRELVVQRSRSFAKALQLEDPNARELNFPERLPPRVAGYSLKKTCGGLLDQLRDALRGDDPDLKLSLYYPEHYSLAEEADTTTENRQRQLVGLIRTLLVKRLESSVRSFEASCLAVLKKMIAFCEVNAEEGLERERLDRWRKAATETYADVEARQLLLWDENGDPTEYDEEDFVPQELLDRFEPLPRSDYEVGQIIDDTYRDMECLVGFLDLVGQVDDAKDDKVKKLLKMLQKDRDLKGRKVLIFTEFAHTARYLEKRLREAGLAGVESVTSRSKKDRRDVVRRFSPFYNKTTSLDLRTDGEEEIEILISTDMLADGLNLQDATRLINYDIHWNPVQIIQRIGRVDRRLDPETEKQISEWRKGAGLNGDRGEVVYWNFLPPDELADLIGLLQRVSNKVFTISSTLGVQTGHLLRPDEQLDDVRLLERHEEFVDGAQSVEEKLQLELRELLKEHPGLEAQLEAIPHGVRSGRKATGDELISGVFFCMRLPGRDMEANTTGEAVWSLEAGRAQWYYVPLGEEMEVVEDLKSIREHIRADRSEGRAVLLDEETLLTARKRVLAHIRNTYQRRLSVPQGHEPDLITWMEVHAA